MQRCIVAPVMCASVRRTFTPNNDIVWHRYCMCQCGYKHARTHAGMHAILNLSSYFALLPFKLKLDSFTLLSDLSDAVSSIRNVLSF